MPGRGILGSLPGSPLAPVPRGPAPLPPRLIPLEACGALETLLIPLDLDSMANLDTGACQPFSPFPDHRGGGGALYENAHEPKDALPPPHSNRKMGPCLPEETKANSGNKRSYGTGQPRPEKEGLGGPGAGEAASICGAIVGREDRKRQSAAGRGGMGTWSWGQPPGSVGSEPPQKQPKRRRAEPGRGDDACSLRFCFISWCGEDVWCVFIR